MSVMDKAKELGKEIRNTAEYKELERATGNVKEDHDAHKMIQDIQELQQQMQFAQQSGVEPSQEQIDQFNEIKSKMDSNLTIQSYAKAQNNFSEFMQSINNAIGEGISPEADVN
ncbi:MAG: YlbF family regulator [Dethiobacteria bacterium]